MCLGRKYLCKYKLPINMVITEMDEYSSNSTSQFKWKFAIITRITINVVNNNNDKGMQCSLFAI